MTTGEIIGGPDRWARLLGWTTLAGIACGIAGPFGSYPANMFTRLAYWIMLFWAGTVMIWPSVALAMARGARHHVPPAFAGAIAILATCVPLAGLAAAGGYLFWPLHSSGMRTLEWYGLTLFVAAPATAIVWWLEMGRTPAEREALPEAAGEAAASVPIPDHLLETALCLQMEDHHVRVHTIGRSSLHFAAMREAIGQLGEARGLQVHRSWWVAEGAVRHAEAEGRAAVLTLTNGLRVPVARSRMPLLRERGWLAPIDQPMADA